MKEENNGCNLLFVQVRQRTSSIDRSIRKVLLECPKDEIFLALLAEIDRDTEAPTALRLAFAGEYSVGKTSLIKALTGADLPIDADVTTTSIHNIRYRDELVLIDMPGTLSGQIAHDQVAQQAIVDSDLMLFVLTNELFNACSLPYFRQAIEDFKKEGQTLLVVNQFDRINMRGRSIEDVTALITTELAERIAPVSIEHVAPVFVSARDYLDAMNEENDHERARLLEESRMADLVEAIDEFCLSRGPAGRLARPLQLRLRMVNDAISQLSVGDDVQHLAQELLHRSLTIFGDVQRSFRAEVRNLTSDVRQKITALAEPVVGLMEGRESPDAIEAAWEDADVSAETIYTDAMEKLKAIAINSSDTLAQKLQKLKESPPAIAMDHIFKGGLQGKGRPGGLPREGSAVLERLVKDHAGNLLKEGGKKLAEHSGELSQKLVEWIGKFHKYRPWGKIKLGGKLAKCLGKFGKALGPLSVLFESYMNYRDEEKAEARELSRMQFKAKVRAALAETADAAVKSIQGCCAEIDEGIFGTRMVALLQQREELANAAGEKQRLLKALVQLDGEIRETLSLISLSKA